MIFHRQFSAEIQIQSQLQELALVFGASGDLDPETGMSVSLPVMDESITKALAAVKGKLFADMPALSREFWALLSPQIPLRKVIIKSRHGEEFVSDAAGSGTMWKVQSKVIQLKTETRIFEFAGTDQPPELSQEFASVRDFLAKIEGLSWKGEVRDLLLKKVYRLF